LEHSKKRDSGVSSSSNEEKSYNNSTYPNESHGSRKVVNSEENAKNLGVDRAHQHQIHHEVCINVAYYKIESVAATNST